MVMRPGICGVIALEGGHIHSETFQRAQAELKGSSQNKVTIGDWYALAQAGYESTGYEDNCLLVSEERVICFEGRIDNRKALAAKLGFAFDAHYSDIISVAFQRWGLSFYQKIIGAFTLCIVLPRLNKVLLANDHMGLRPLYLSEVDKAQLVFGADISQILAHSSESPKVNTRKMLEMLSPLYVDNESWFDPHSTLIDGITMLPRGTALEMDRRGNKTVTEYWKPPTTLRRDVKDIRTCAEEFRGIYMAVIKDHMDTKYPIGADLSSGIDSGCNVSVIAHLLSEQEKAHRAFHTFTVVFGDEDPREKAKIDAVLREYEFIEHHYIQGNDLCGHLESGQYREFRATANCSRMNIPESYVAICQLASRLGCRSVITGEAADWYLEGADIIWDSLIKSGNFSELARSVRVLSSRTTWKNLLQYLYVQGVRPLLPGTLGRKAYLNDQYAGTMKAEIPDLFTASFQKELHEFIRMQRSTLLRKKNLSVWNQQVEQDMMFPPNHGWQGIAVETELRLPYLDPRLLEFGLSIPPEFKFRIAEDRTSYYGSGKCLQRFGLSDIVPKEIIESQHKATYSTPTDTRLTNSLPIVFGNVQSALITEMGITDPQKLQSAIEYVLSEKTSGPSDPVIAWLDTLLALELWLRATNEDFGLA